MNATHETLLMALRGDDSEPVLIGLDEGTATFELDDGQTVAFDLTELRQALAEHYTIRCDACGRLGLDTDPECDHVAAWFVTARGWNEWRPFRAA